MTLHALYDGPAGTGRLEITARPGKGSGGRPVWLVDICRWGRAGGKALDRTAAWLPGFDCWDESRWFPNNLRQVPPAVLATVEAWLRGRAVPSIKPTTTETP
jgi:hypothetical protein